ncbi:hypothetical protein ACWD0G_12665 [Streptomyces goshikiensis]
MHFHTDAELIQEFGEAGLSGLHVHGIEGQPAGSAALRERLLAVQAW